MPSRFARRLYGAMLPHLNPEMRFVSATKGLENGTLLRMSEVAREVIERNSSLGSPFFPGRRSPRKWRAASRRRW